MTVLVWDELSDRFYENGLDRGILYLPDGTAISWNGLTSIIEKFNREPSPVYYDGKKVSNFVVGGEFQATIRAITYPDEFEELEGLGIANVGVSFGDQYPKMFGLCYRTKVDSVLGEDSSGYKIHIIYNVTATPTDRSYSTLTDSISIIEFEWDITTIPEEIPGFAPTAHIIIDSRQVDPWFLEDIEALLYGTDDNDAYLPPLSELSSFLTEWRRIRIIDNGNGTWTAISAREGFITIDPETDYFTIEDVNAVYLDEDTYVISDT